MKKLQFDAAMQASAALPKHLCTVASRNTEPRSCRPMPKALPQTPCPSFPTATAAPAPGACNECCVCAQDMQVAARAHEEAHNLAQRVPGYMTQQQANEDLEMKAGLHKVAELVSTASSEACVPNEERECQDQDIAAFPCGFSIS